MYTELDELELVVMLLTSMGLSIDHNQTLIDQETMAQIKFQGKNIKASFDRMKPVYITEGDIKFEPLNRNNIRLLSTLFGHFLDKEQEYGNINRVLTFYPEEILLDDGSRRTKIIVKCEKNEVYESDYFENKCLVYCDLINKICGDLLYNRIDLHKFDV